VQERRVARKRESVSKLSNVAYCFVGEVFLGCGGKSALLTTLLQDVLGNLHGVAGL
jgi:hypothetical protein